MYPVFPEGLPQWMERDWARPLVLTDEVGPMPDSADPMGANLSFRRSVFETIGDFRVDLGRKGNSLLCGEDAEIVRRLRKAGFEAWFVCIFWPKPITDSGKSRSCFLGEGDH